MASPKAALQGIVGRFVFRSTVQGVRRALKARETSLGNAKAKAYWAPGKKGLD